MTGCTSFIAQRGPLFLERPKECQAFLTALDQEVDNAGVRDAANYPVPGFPYFRTNRFLSRLKDNIHSDEGRERWSGWMRMLDLESRKKEISNLPDVLISSMTMKQATPSSHPQRYEQVDSCSETLFQHDKTRSDFYQTLLPLVDVPDEYSIAMRTFGLYPLVAIPVAILTDISRKKIQSWYDTSLENLPVDGRLRAFIPAEGFSLGENEVQTFIEASRENPQGVPLPDQNLRKRLVQHFAPVFIQDVVASYDQIG